MRKPRPQRQRARGATATDSRGRKVRGLHQFTVQKPYCTPSRAIVMNALQPYAIPVYGFSETVNRAKVKDLVEIKKLNGQEPDYGDVPLSQSASFAVPSTMAGWAEDLLVSTGRLAVTKGHVPGRGVDGWAKGRGGNMPTPWDASAGVETASTRRIAPFVPPEPGMAVIEDDCVEGKRAWQLVGNLRKKADANAKRK